MDFWGAWLLLNETKENSFLDSRPTFVHRFIVQDTIEATIHRTISDDESGAWASKQVTIDELEKLFALTQPLTNGMAE